MKSFLPGFLTNSKIRYLIVGGSSFCFEYASFLGLYGVTRNLIVSNTLSFLIGLIYSFALHRIWSFSGEHRHKAHHQFVGYAVLAGVNILISNLLIVGFAKGLHISPFIAKIIAMLAIVLWNYILLSKVIFARTHVPDKL